MTTTDLTVTSSSLPERMDYARALSASSLLPQAFRGNPANALVAIEYGNALGIAPIVALSEINVISGTPSLSASLMAALARQAGHKVRVSGDAEAATCTIVRGDDPDYEHTATWTKAKAQAAGLWGKGHWGKDPGTMLRWRAISECVRFACSEVLGGLRYTPEEVAEFTGGTVDVGPVQATPVRSGNARLAAAVAQHDPAPSAHTPAEHEAPPATRAQVTALNAAMTEAGITDRPDKLVFLTERVGRPIGSSKELSKDEASAVLDWFNGAPTEDAPPTEDTTTYEQTGAEWPDVAQPGGAA